MSVYFVLELRIFVMMENTNDVFFFIDKENTNDVCYFCLLFCFENVSNNGKH